MAVSSLLDRFLSNSVEQRLSVRLSIRARVYLRGQAHINKARRLSLHINANNACR